MPAFVFLCVCCFSAGSGLAAFGVIGYAFFGQADKMLNLVICCIPFQVFGGVIMIIFSIKEK